MDMTFTKMQGAGNDFILVDCREKDWASYGKDTVELSRFLCDRRFGIGADQILLLYPSDVADFKMKIVNADGTEVEMCGNGIRCLARYIWDRGLSDKDTLEIETLAGLIRPERAGDMVRVDMGKPVLEPEKVPVLISGENERVDRLVAYPLMVDNMEFDITCVSMGNPHAVIFLEDDPADFPVPVYGPLIENHPIFPKRTNVEFVSVKNRDEVVMRVWERGSGETLACGTGASAAGVASILKGLTNRKVTVHLRGGDLVIEWPSEGHVFMTGPAAVVFEGKIKI